MNDLGGLRAILIISASFALISCMGKNLKTQNAPLGVEASSATVQTALDQATGGISIANAKVGSCVTYEENYRINADPVLMSQLIKHTLLSMTTSAASISVNLFEDSYSFYPSGAIQDQVHRQLALDIPTATATSPAPPPTNLCNGQVRDDGDGVKYDCEKYYNLETDDNPVAAPQAVQEKPNCLGFSKCEIPVHHIHYDIVKFLKGNEVNKTTFDASFSSAIPDLLYLRQPDGSYVYTEAATSFCTTTVETGSDNSNYMVRLCSVLRDMQPDGNGDCLPPTP